MTTSRTTTSDLEHKIANADPDVRNYIAYLENEHLAFGAKRNPRTQYNVEERGHFEDLSNEELRNSLQSLIQSGQFTP